MNSCRFNGKKNKQTKTKNIFNCAIGELQKRKVIFSSLFNLCRFSKLIHFKMDSGCKRTLAFGMKVKRTRSIAHCVHRSAYILPCAMTLRSWERCYYTCTQTHSVAIKLWKILSLFVGKKNICSCIVAISIQCWMLKCTSGAWIQSKIYANGKEKKTTTTKQCT